MSYSLYDSRGYVADIASGGGWTDFRAACETQEPGPETESLVEDGFSDFPADLAAELQAVRFDDPSADSVRQQLAATAAKCEDVCILTDGVGFDDEEGDRARFNPHHGADGKFSSSDEAATTTHPPADAPKLEHVFGDHINALPTNCANAVHSREDLFARAPHALADFDSSMDHGQGVDRAIGGKAIRPTSEADFLNTLKTPGVPAVIIAPLKSEKRAAEKVEGKYQGDYSRLTDVVRGTIAVDKVHELPAALKAIDSEMGKRGWTLAQRPEDRISTPCAGGYRDAVLKYRNEKGIVAEILVSTKAMILAEQGEGRKLFEQYRVIDEASKRENRPKTAEEKSQLDALDAAMQKGYNDAWRSSGGKV